MGEKVSKATADRLAASINRAGAAERASDATAAKRLGMTEEEYQKYLLRLFNKAAVADKMYPSMRKN